jgi:hypothetical protein
VVSQCSALSVCRVRFPISELEHTREPNYALYMVELLHMRTFTG